MCRFDHGLRWVAVASMVLIVRYAALAFLIPALMGQTVRIAARGPAASTTPFPYCVPGFALHQELALLTAAGLSPAAALRTKAVMRRGHLIEAAALRSMLDGVRTEAGNNAATMGR